jgi:DNA polymerase-1
MENVNNGPNRRCIVWKVFDSETDGLNPYMGARIFAWSWGGEEGDANAVRIDALAGKTLMMANRTMLRGFLLDTSISKVGHNIKFDLGMCLMSGFSVPEDTVLEDTILLARVLRNDLPAYDLSYLYTYYGGGHEYDAIDKKIDYAAKETKAKYGEKDYSKIDPVLMHEYQLADTIRTSLLFQVLYPEVFANKKRFRDYRVEVELLRPTQRMEQEGIRIDMPKAVALKSKLNFDAAVARGALNKIAGRAVNPNSPKDVTWLLYEKLRLPIMGYTEKGAISTDQSILLELRKHHKAADLILQAKAFSRGASTIEGYAEFLDNNNKIHPNINTCEAATGRESCDSPNLQNVSKDTSIKNPYPIPLRRVFRADPGELLLFVDYAGIEMRLIIEATGEPELMALLQRDRNADVHYPTVECFEGVGNTMTMKINDPKKFKTLRGAYKNVGFCVGYGGGEEKVAGTLNRPIDEIINGLNVYRKRFHRIATFSSSMIHLVKKQGFIETPFGRRLYIPRGKAYIASNYRIQGAAAGILKRGQIAVGKLIDKKYSRWIRPVLPIHDEIVFAVKRDVLKDLTAIRAEMRECLVTMPEIRVPLEVEWKMSTTTWINAVEVK